jgi:hypothetical protein
MLTAQRTSIQQLLPRYGLTGEKCDYAVLCSQLTQNPILAAMAVLLVSEIDVIVSFLALGHLTNILTLTLTLTFKVAKKNKTRRLQSR